MEEKALYFRKKPYGLTEKYEIAGDMIRNGKINCFSELFSEGYLSLSNLSKVLNINYTSISNYRTDSSALAKNIRFSHINQISKLLSVKEIELCRLVLADSIYNKN